MIVQKPLNIEDMTSGAADEGAQTARLPKQNPYSAGYGKLSLWRQLLLSAALTDKTG